VNIAHTHTIVDAEECLFAHSGSHYVTFLLHSDFDRFKLMDLNGRMNDFFVDCQPVFDCCVKWKVYKFDVVSQYWRLSFRFGAARIAKLF
jgi:hypothetical protein